MIRLVQRRLIIPRGDTGTFSVPVLKPGQTGNVAVFTIFDTNTRTKVFTKEVVSEGDVLNITLTHLETVNLQAGKYLWDIKYYSNPVYTDDELTDGEEVDSYYAGFTLPVCEIRETADNFLLADDAPGATLTPTQLDMISAALRALQHGIAQVQENVEHYPYIQDNYWYVWDSESEQFVNSEVCANGIPGRTPIIQDDKWWMWDAEAEAYVDSGIPVYPDISNLILAQEEQPTEEENKIWFKTGESDVLELPTYDEMVETVQNVVAYQEEQPDSDLNRIWIPTTSEQTVAIPSYEEFEAGLAAKLEAKDVAAVAMSGEYTDLVGAPTNVSAFTNDAGYLTAHQDLSGKQDKLTFDSAPTANSNNPVTSGGIYDAITHINTMKIHVCSTQEYDNEGVPTVANPTADTFYLVPGGEGTNLFVEWAFVNGAWERFGSADVDLSNYVQKTDYATKNTAGVVKVDGSNGIVMVNNTLTIGGANATVIKQGTDIFRPIVPNRQDASTFYGLAKAAHDTTQSVSSNAVGTYTNEAKAAIQQMLDVPAKSDIPTKVSDLTDDSGHYTKPASGIPASDLADGVIPEVPVTDVQVAGSSVVGSDGIANIPVANANTAGVIKVFPGYGLEMTEDGNITFSPAPSNLVKRGVSQKKIIVPYNQHESTFYGLSKVAGVDLANENVTPGTYPETSKTAIRSMLGATSSNVIAVQDTQPTDADTKIWLPETAEAPVQVPTVAEMNTALAGKVGDVQVNGVSVVSGGVANVPIASSGTWGVTQPLAERGTSSVNGKITTYAATDSNIKNASNSYQPIVPTKQHQSTFYGLAKAAGDTTQAASDNAVGTYTDNAKAAIQTMLGIDLSSIASQVDIPLVETVTGTAVTITGQPNTRYMCGEVLTIDITPPASGSIDVFFTSGTTAAVLTVPNTVKFPDSFDATALSTNTIYEICITDGVYGSVMTWAN